MSEYILTFNEIIENFDLFKLGIIIENENGQRYKLTKTDNDYRKFSRIDKGLRFMTYDNINKKFKIIEEQEEIDIQSIKDIKDIYIENASCGEDVKYLARKYNEILKWAKQLDKKIKEKE